MKTNLLVKTLRRNAKIGLALTLAVIAGSVTATAGYVYWTTIQPQPQPVELRIFIASSLASVVAAHKTTFEQQHNCKIILNTAGSNTLYNQIITESPCDVFMSADAKWTNTLNASGWLIDYDNEEANLTTNRLIVILPKANTAGITDLSNLTKAGIRIIIADWTVPVGSYTNKTLANIDRTWGNATSPLYNDTGLYVNYRSKFVANIVSYETSVQSVVSKIVLGLDGDAGVAYITDANAQGANLEYLDIPNSVNVVGTYGLGVINATSHLDLAQQYVDSWLSVAGQNLLGTYGFGL